MQRATPGLIIKIGTHRPLVVCFVGKVIWSHVEPQLVRISKEKGNQVQKRRFSYDLQPYKLVYPEDTLEGRSVRRI